MYHSAGQDIAQTWNQRKYWEIQNLNYTHFKKLVVNLQSARKCLCPFRFLESCSETSFCGISTFFAKRREVGITSKTNVPTRKIRALGKNYDLRSNIPIIHPKQLYSFQLYFLWNLLCCIWNSKIFSGTLEDLAVFGLCYWNIPPYKPSVIQTTKLLEHITAFLRPAQINCLFVCLVFNGNSMW